LEKLCIHGKHSLDKMAARFALGIQEPKTSSSNYLTDAERIAGP